jgi:general secretion pathway protein L
MLEGRREAIRRTLTQTFPQVKVVVDAPVQMDREVATLRQSTGAASGRDLEAMLGALAGALPPQQALAGFDYNNGELRARGLRLSTDQAQQLAGALRGQGYAVTPSGDVLAVTPLQVQP